MTELKRNWKRLLLRAVFVLILLLVAAELVLRFALGLGTPPLSIADPDIDYYFAPNQDLHRFGHHVVYNNVSMRCDFDVLPPYTGRRLLITGDSVINGGMITSHEDLATTILQRHHADWMVYNVSAGSWGPGNVAAFLRKFGTFGATDIIVEMNSHDVYEDDPVQSAGHTVDVDESFPGHNPTCALSEFFDRYCNWGNIRYLAITLHLIDPKVLLEKKNTARKVDAPHWDADVDGSRVRYNLQMLDEIFSYPWQTKALLISRSRKETQKNIISPGEKILRAWASEHQIPVMLFPATLSDYRDTIHLSAEGQHHLADFIDSQFNFKDKNN